MTLKVEQAKIREVARVISLIRPIVDSCKNEYEEGFCFYHCEVNNFCKQIKEKVK